MHFNTLAVLLMMVLAGCGKQVGKVEPDKVDAPARAEPKTKSEASKLCDQISRSIADGDIMISREWPERLEAIAEADPDILASPSDAAKARKIAGQEGLKWPVVEQDGHWYVLQDEGDPAADGFYRVTIISAKTGKLVGRITDTLGNIAMSIEAKRPAVQLGNLVVITCPLKLDIREMQGSFQTEGPDGEMMDVAGPREYRIVLKVDGEEVYLPWNEKRQPSMFDQGKEYRFTLRREKRPKGPKYVIQKIERTHGVVYEEKK